MAEPHPANEMHHRKDSSNFQYAGMYLTLVATLLFLVVFLFRLAYALDVLDDAGEWVWDVIWEATVAFMVLIGGFAAVGLTYKRRGYPAVITIMTLMLAISLLNILRPNIWIEWLDYWMTLSIITFVVTMVAFVKLSIGHKEFLSPRLKKEMAAKEKVDVKPQWDDKPIYHEEPKGMPRAPPKKASREASRRSAQPARARAAQPAKPRARTPKAKPAPKARSRPRREGTTVKIINCPKCAEMFPNDEPYCPLCGDDSNKKVLLEKIQVAYESGVISKEQYLSNLERFSD